MAHEGITSEQAIALSKALDRHTDDSQLAQFAIISFINWMVEINAGHLLQTTNGWSHKDSHSGEFVEHGDWRMTIDIRRDLSYREKEASDEGDSILRLIEESHSWPNITAVQRNGIYASIWFLLVGRSGRTRYSFGLAVPGLVAQVRIKRLNLFHRASDKLVEAMAWIRDRINGVQTSQFEPDSVDEMLGGFKELHSITFEINDPYGRKKGQSC